MQGYSGDPPAIIFFFFFMQKVLTTTRLTLIVNSDVHMFNYEPLNSRPLLSHAHRKLQNTENYIYSQ